MTLWPGPPFERRSDKNSVSDPRQFIRKTKKWCATKLLSLYTLLKLSTSQQVPEYENQNHDQSIASATPQNPSVTAMGSSSQKSPSIHEVDSRATPSRPIYSQHLSRQITVQGKQTNEIDDLMAATSPKNEGESDSAIDRSNSHSRRSSRSQFGSLPSSIHSDMSERFILTQHEAQSTAPSLGSCISQFRPHEDSLKALAKRREHADRPYLVAMCIHVPDDPTGAKAKKCFAFLDTGSSLCLTYSKVMREIGYSSLVALLEEKPALRTLGGQPLKVIGRISLTWNVSTTPTSYTTTFIVLEDPEDGKPHWDFLLGRDWIGESEALVLDHTKVPLIHYIVSKQPSAT